MGFEPQTFTTGLAPEESMRIAAILGWCLFSLVRNLSPDKICLHELHVVNLLTSSAISETAKSFTKKGSLRFKVLVDNGG